MKPEEFDNVSLDYLMGVLSPEEKKRFTESLSEEEKVDFAEKQRLFKLVQQEEVVASQDLVNKIMTKVDQEVVVNRSSRYFGGLRLKSFAAPSAATITAIVAVLLFQREPLPISGTHRPVIEAEKPIVEKEEMAKNYLVNQLKNDNERARKNTRVAAKKLTGERAEVMRPELGSIDNTRSSDGSLKGVSPQSTLMEGDELRASARVSPDQSHEGRFYQTAVGALPQPPTIQSEQYGVYSESGPVLTANQPVSTFSIDVDTGSYTNVRKLLRMGALPPKSAVRTEEMLNYFDYSYPESAGEEPFSFSYEAAPSPFNSEKVYLKLGIKAKTSPRDDNQGWNLVFLVDVSGSMMDADKLPLLKDSMKILAERMRPQDRLSIVTYSGNSTIALEPTSGREKDKIFTAINQLAAGGSTNGSGGILAAYAQAERHKIDGGVNRVILATDGDFNVGISSFDGLVKLVEEKRRTGITLTTLGVGRGNYNEQNLEQLANKGNGNYFYLDSIDEASRVLGSQLVSNMEVVAKDVKLQIEFNPAKVISYRLVGYDNRVLRNEDFKDDTVDAGEIGAGHTVTALYELVLDGSKAASALMQDELRYQPAIRQPVSVEATNLSELAFLKIRYKAPNGEQSRLLQFPLKAERIADDSSKTTDDFRFAAAVGGFGQLLAESRFTEGLSLSQVRELATGAIGADTEGKRKEFLELVNLAIELRR